MDEDLNHTSSKRQESREKRSGSASEYDESVPRKKRRRCGTCEPCTRKVNCGDCSNCVNRKTGHQICKYRKCVQLKKKTSTVLPQPRENTSNAKQESSEPSSPVEVQSTRLSPAKVASDSDDAEIVSDSNEESKPQAPSKQIDIDEKAKLSSPSNHQSENSNIREEVMASLSATNVCPEVVVQETSCSQTAIEQNALTPPNNTAPRCDESPAPQPCRCQVSPKEDGPEYTQLGNAPTIEGIRTLMEKRFGIEGEALRIEQITYTNREGKNSQGCPIARWVIKRSGPQEKVLVVARKRTSHQCDLAYLVCSIVIWEGIPRAEADSLYRELTNVIPENGLPTARRCNYNDSKSCACQGMNEETCGASFSFGCSWNMYFNGCKFARTKSPRKFKLLDPTKEEQLENTMQDIATFLTPIYKQAAPEAFANQIKNKDGFECRIGNDEGDRPFSGITCCMDFCAHSHKDKQNMDGGATVVCTLLKPEAGADAEDEQLHVLPMYQLLDQDGKVASPNYVMPAHMRSPSLDVSSVFKALPKEDKEKSQNAIKTNAEDRKEAVAKKEHSPLTENQKNPYINGGVYGDRFHSNGLGDPPYGYPTSVVHHHPAANHIMNGYYNNHFSTKSHLPYYPFLGSNLFVDRLRSPDVRWVDENHIPYLYRTHSAHMNHYSQHQHYPLEYPEDHKGIFPPGNPWSMQPPPAKTFSEEHLRNGIHGGEATKPKAVIHHYSGAPIEWGKSLTDIKYVDEKDVPVMRSNSPGVQHEQGRGPPVKRAQPGKQSAEVSPTKKVYKFDEAMGGVALALTPGSLLIEVAKKEIHATTPLKNPQRHSPTRISLVFYQHKQLNTRYHGLDEWEQKVARKKMLQEEAAAEKGGGNTARESALHENYLDMLAETALSREDKEPQSVLQQAMTWQMAGDNKQQREDVQKKNNVGELVKMDINNNMYDRLVNEDPSVVTETFKESRLPSSQNNSCNDLAQKMHAGMARDQLQKLRELRESDIVRHLHGWPREQCLPNGIVAPRSHLEDRVSTGATTSRANVIDQDERERHVRQAESFQYSKDKMRENKTSIAQGEIRSASTVSNYSVSRLLGKDTEETKNHNKASRPSNASSTFCISNILGNTTKASDVDSKREEKERLPVPTKPKSPPAVAKTNGECAETKNHCQISIPSEHERSGYPETLPNPHQYGSTHPQYKTAHFCGGMPDKAYYGAEHRMPFDLHSDARAHPMAQYSPYKFGMPFPTQPTFFMPSFHPLLSASNGLTPNLALVNSRNYLSSLASNYSHSKRLEESLLAPISTATRTGLSYPIDSLITVAPYSQTCVTGHYQNWL
ncbi:methylcytosine dioxygenase TET2-like [Actinia tenebrosa]|uniref:Methylcytosine dioxygenase TET n=1 Tax=Actinia tenebrosa TaxID=6105 RepID=A0A6P8I8M3_ACTTE|nr:methylcytosine dioxygenase TET2-like [Actinia tenebrosa]